MGNKIFKVVQGILLLVIIAVFCFSLYKVITIVMEYREGRKEYEVLEGFVKIESNSIRVDRLEKEETETVEEDSAKPDPEADKESQKGDGQDQKKDKIELFYHDNFPNVQVDYASLTNMNPDFVGWLYIPGLSISYPMVLGADNDYYLTHTFQKTENSAGALFLDQATVSPFADYNTVVHGHNMKNGSMFGKLKNYYRDTQVYADDPYFYVYTPGNNYKYFIFSYYVTDAASDSYQLPNTEDAYRTYKDYVAKQGVYQEIAKIPEVAPIVTLSTCYGDTYTDLRLVVHGILIETK